MFQKNQKLHSRGLSYQLLSTLKSTPKGTSVYKALREDESGELRQEVILKLFPKSEETYQWEFESLLQAQSPFCAKLLSFETFNKQKAFVLESIHGVSLFQLISHFILSPEEISYLLQQIYEGLLDLKAKGLCHGDLSLNNVLVTKESCIKFIDFGKGNYTTLLQGTPPFPAPEVLSGSRPHFLSDLFSLGVLEIFLKEPHRFHFLKEQDASFFLKQNSSLLKSDPKERCFSPKTQTSTSPSSLSFKVKELYSQIHKKNWNTAPLLQKNQGSFWIKSLLLCILFLSSSSSLSKKGLLRVHTHQWFFIQVNRLKSYAPLEWPLTQGTHQIHWKNAKGQSGTKKVYLKGNDLLFLTDRDFHP